eukprot:6468918-Amphidinium_carterae.1
MMSSSVHCDEQGDGRSAHRVHNAPLYSCRERFPLQHSRLPSWNLSAMPIPMVPSERVRDSDEHASLLSHAVCSLNALAHPRAGLGLRSNDHTGLVPRPTDVVQQCMIDRCGQAISELGPPPAGILPDGSLDQLLKSRGLYAPEESASVVPYDPERLKIFKGETVPKHVCDLVHWESLPFVREPERCIVRTQAEVDEVLSVEGDVTVHMDPALENANTMIDFLERLHAVGLLGFTRRAKSFVGCFFVSKKDNSQRLVVDARQTNQLHRRPPFSPLCTAGALSNVDLSNCQDVPYAVGSDFQDGFYQFRFDEMAPGFAFNFRVQAKDFAVKGVWDTDTGLWAEVDEEEWLFPTFRGLVMGWSWGLYFCHSALVRALVESVVVFSGVTEEVADQQIVRERAPPPKLLPRLPLLCPYVDNANVICANREDAEEFYKIMLDVLERKGFTLKDLVSPTTVMDLVGVRFDGGSLCLRNKPERVWKLIYAIREVIAMRVIPGWVLRVLNGHLVSQFLIHRCALSCLSDCFAFALHNLDKWTRLPESVISELRVSCGILPLIRADLGASWVRWLLCSDASDKGYALHASQTPPEKLSTVACWKENWRYKEVSVQTVFDEDEFRGISAEDFSKAPTFESWVADRVDEGKAHRVRAPYRHHVRPLWLENPHEVPDLPEDLVERGLWQRMLVGSWKYPSTIHMLEAKVALRGLHRVVLNSNWHGHRLLSLGDNSAEVLAMSAGRCKNKALNGVCRQAASLQLASGVRWYRRYINTHRNPSDADSRLANAGKITGGRYFSRYLTGLDPDAHISGKTDRATPSGCLVVSAEAKVPYYYSYRPVSNSIGNDFCRYEDLSNPVWEAKLGSHIVQSRPKLVVVPWTPSGCLHASGHHAARHKRSGHALARIIELAVSCHSCVVLVGPDSRDPWNFSPLRRATAGWKSVSLKLDSNSAS